MGNFQNFCIADWCYVGAISFQLAGAVLLLIGFCGKTWDRILNLYFPGSNFANVKDGMVELEKEKIQKCARKIYQNRVAFLYISLGYILGVYGEIVVSDKNSIIVGIVLGSIGLIIFEQIVSCIISRIIYRKDIKEEYAELEKKTDLDVSVIEF